MRVRVPERLRDTPAWCVVSGLALAFLAGILLLFGSLKAPPRDSLRIVSGEVEKTDRSCSRGVCWLHLYVRTSAGQVTLVQDDFAAAAGALKLLRVSDRVTILAAEMARDDLAFWQLNRGDELLLSYDEAGKGFASHRNRLSLFGYIVAASAIFLLAVGILLGIRRGTWRVAA